MGSLLSNWLKSLIDSFYQSSIDVVYDFNRRLASTLANAVWLGGNSVPAIIFSDNLRIPSGQHIPTQE